MLIRLAPVVAVASLGWLVACASASFSAPQLAAAEAISATGIQASVEYLASDALEGRYYLSPKGHEAAQWIADRFEELGGQPAGGEDSLLRPIEDPAASPNVVACWPGTGEGYVLITAHYDHLEPLTSGEDRIFNGADDNASGTAGLIEIAKALNQLEEPPTATIVLVAFTAEEYGLLGSEHFVADPPFPLEEVRAVLNIDMISRGEEDLMFVVGADRFPAIGEAYRAANEHVGLDLRFDEFEEWIYLSDQWPFVQRGVPGVYVGVDYHDDYHQVSDEADRILPGLAANTSKATFLAALRLAD